MRKVYSIIIAILAGIITMWMILPNRVWLPGEKDLLCRLDIQRGSPNDVDFFTTSETLERFFVYAQPEKKGERLSLTITGENNFLCSFSAITKPMRFSFSPGDIPAGTYKIVLKQEEGNYGGKVFISKKEIGMTGWYIWSRAMVILLAISGILVVIVRKSQNQRLRAMSVFIFHTLLLGLVVIFIYLLCHEGGHALAASFFGQIDWARSDFFGIHGTPRAGLKAGTPVEPWQRAIISFAGPLLPTLMGWVLFLIWRSKKASRIRNRHPMVNIYFTSIVFMCVFPFIAVLGCLLGLISDGDWRGFIENVPGPLWLVKVLILVVLLVNGLILWRIVRELRQILKTKIAKIKTIVRESNSNM